MIDIDNIVYFADALQKEADSFWSYIVNKRPTEETLYRLKRLGDAIHDYEMVRKNYLSQTVNGEAE